MSDSSARDHVGRNFTGGMGEPVTDGTRFTQGREGPETWRAARGRQARHGNRGTDVGHDERPLVHDFGILDPTSVVHLLTACFEDFSNPLRELVARDGVGKAS